MDEVPSRALSIREVADRSGCSPSALRYYEAEGLIAPLPRGDAYARTYSPRVLDALDVITSLRGAGFGISEIRAFLSVKDVGGGVNAKLEKALEAIKELGEVVRQRRAALEKADTLLQEWRAELEEYRRSH
ncbi:MerR family transcriptional regulator [Deinococcus antarcticus]|uniref:MerR family transcriptional regulator n=1 Tax=Deinococcus antarcticus TaxID=1298767 RepID=A0ABV8A696_9DEIO